MDELNGIEMQRNEKIDIAKGIASYLVVLGHLLSQIGNSKITIITFCHMPFFFFISGYLMHFSFHKYRLLAFIRKKFYNLVVPYFSWSMISFLANGLIGKIDKQTIWNEFVEIFFEARSVWFLIILFFALTVLAFCLYIANVIGINQYVVSMAAWLLLSVCIPDHVFSFVKFKWLFPFMVLGYALAEKKDFFNLGSMNKNIFVKGVIALFPIIALFAYNEHYFERYLFFCYANFREALVGIVYYVVSMLGVCFIVLIADRACSYRVARGGAEAGRYSMHIYVMHMFMVKFIFYAPDVVRVHRCFFLWIYMPIYAVIVLMVIVALSKKVFVKSKLFQIMIGKR